MFDKVRHLTWWGAALGLLLLMLGQAVLPIPREKIYVIALLDAGHVPLFVVFTWVVIALLSAHPRLRGLPLWSKLLVGLLIALAMGIATELVQTRVQRDADAMDLERDLFGALAALAAFLGWRFRARPRSVGAWLAAVIFLGSGLLEPARTLDAYRHRDANFPVLADFDDAWQETFLAGRRATFTIGPPPEGWSDARGRVLIAEFPAKGLPAITLREPRADWSDYEALEFDVFNPSDRELGLDLRIEDDAHRGWYSDRYNGVFPIAPGPGQVRIPLETLKHAPRDREMDLHHMHAITWFLGDRGQTDRLYFDNVRLTNSLSR